MGLSALPRTSFPGLFLVIPSWCRILLGLVSLTKDLLAPIFQIAESFKRELTDQKENPSKAQNQIKRIPVKSTAIPGRSLGI